MKMTITGFAYCEPAKIYEHNQPNVVGGFVYRYSPSDASEWGGGIISAGTAKLIIETPEGFDPSVGAIAALNQQRKNLQAEFQARINEIEKQISKYTAIAG